MEIAICITAHSESFLIGSLLESLIASKRYAETLLEDPSVKLCICLDAPSPGTLSFVKQCEPCFDLIEYVDFKDQAQTRNHLVQLVTSEFIGFMDGDDMCSENWIYNSLASMNFDPDSRTIVHPELNWFFGGSDNILVKLSASDPLFNKYLYVIANHYDALCIAPRQAWIECPYEPRKLDQGYAYEDWQWNLDTTWRGWEHISSQDTIIFKRRRSDSQTIKASARSTCVRIERWPLEFFSS